MNKNFFVIPGLILLLFFLTGCSKEEFKPQADFNLDNQELSIQSGNITPKFVTATITRIDEGIGTNFTLNFDNKETVYATDVDGNKISTLSTRSLKGKFSIDTLQFKIFGKKLDEDLLADKSLSVKLMWNNTTLDEKIIKVKVN